MRDSACVCACAGLWRKLYGQAPGDVPARRRQERVCDHPLKRICSKSFQPYAIITHQTGLLLLSDETCGVAEVDLKLRLRMNWNVWAAATSHLTNSPGDRFAAAQIYKWINPNVTTDDDDGLRLQRLPGQSPRPGRRSVCRRWPPDNIFNQGTLAYGDKAEMKRPS